MHVAVTGSSGKIGPEAVSALKSGMMDGVRTVACDCVDFGRIMGVLGGVDTAGRPQAVVHLSGIPMPGLAPDQVTFAANTISAYNVFSAAAPLGIDRVAWGSSETIHGLPFATPPEFVPMDETHSDRPEWSYSLSTKLGGTMGEEFRRWKRDLWIVSPRFFNANGEADYQTCATIKADPSQRKGNLWGYVDARDAGEACRLAVEPDLCGHHRFLCTASTTCTASGRWCSSPRRAHAGPPVRA